MLMMEGDDGDGDDDDYGNDDDDDICVGENYYSMTMEAQEAVEDEHMRVRFLLPLMIHQIGS